MLLRGQLLVAEERDTAFAQRLPDLGQSRLAWRRRQIDAGNLRANGGRERCYPDMMVGHAYLPNRRGVSQCGYPVN
jgi:hypothetical protein